MAVPAAPFAAEILGRLADPGYGSAMGTGGILSFGIAALSQVAAFAAPYPAGVLDIGAPLDQDGLGIGEGVGGLLPGGGEDALQCPPGDIHAGGGLALVHAYEVTEAKRLGFLDGEGHVCGREALGLGASWAEYPHRGNMGNDPADLGAAHPQSSFKVNQSGPTGPGLIIPYFHEAHALLLVRGIG